MITFVHMITRYSMTLLALWALFLAPFLCGTGLLAHACAYTETTDCHHNLACSPDPCRVLVIKTTVQDNVTDEATGHPLSPVLPALADESADRPPTRILEVVPSPPDLPDLAASHRPLPLIC